jgi:subtilisin family serine protease
MENDGTRSWFKKINGSVNKLPVGVNLAPNGSIYASVVNEGAAENDNELINYTQYEQGSNVILNDSAVPVCKDNELIIRFKHDVLNTDAIDNNIGNRHVEFESLDYFLTAPAMNKFNEVMGKICESLDPEDPNPCDVIAVKLFKQLKTTDTTTISRMGEVIKIPDFWTTLLLVFPDYIDIGQAFSILDNASNIIAYAEPNLFAKTMSAPNDYYYPNQYSLYSLWDYPEAHINMEEAWDVFPDAGLEHIKCGVFDTGINYKHEDFGYDGINDASSKVRGGWDFEYPQSIYTTNIPDYGHGTPCAGIIGAIRNNTIGVAGIAGGDYQGNNDFSDKGVSLYALKIMNQDTLIGNPIQNIYDAIVSSSIDDTLDYTYGLNIASNSWRITDGSPVWYTDTNLTLIKEATHFANRAKVTFVAARGNEGIINRAYPAIIDDDWILSVGGSGNNGLRKTKFNGSPQGGGHSSSYGMDMDVIAPATTQLVSTTRYAPAPTNGSWYQSFSMTSAATPHVAGTVGLLQSYLNDTVPAYKNLAPEDCEHILELTAFNKANPGNYSDTAGWGLIDAGAAFRLIELPWNTVHHFGSNVTFPNFKGYTIEALGSTIELKEQVQNYDNEWFDKGEYDVNIYRYDATVHHGSEINSIDTIVAYWARPSSSRLLEPVYNDSLLPRERVQIDYLDRDSCVMHGYVYELLDNSGNSIGWLPKDTLTLRPVLEYTVLTRDSTAPVATVNTYTDPNQKINLYPNPTSNMHTLELSGFDQKNIRVELYDIRGRKLSTIHNGIVNQEETFQINVSHLNAGVYFYAILSENIRKNIRFIKQ